MIDLPIEDIARKEGFSSGYIRRKLQFDPKFPRPRRWVGQSPMFNAKAVRKFFERHRRTARVGRPRKEH